MKIFFDETKPDYINEKGVKWWLDKSTTNFAQRPDHKGITLNITCFFVEEPNGYKTRVLIDNDIKEVIYEDTTLDGIGSKIDILKLKKDINGGE